MNDQLRPLNEKTEDLRLWGTGAKVDSASRKQTAPECMFDAHSEYALNAVILYQDEETRNWAEEVCSKATDLVGQEQLKARWWNVDELTNPLALAEAVFRTKRSDLIIVAVHASRVLPPIFHVWAHLWLPNTGRPECALVALLGVSQDCGDPAEALRFLKTLSQEGGVELIIDRRQFASVAPFSVSDRDSYRLSTGLTAAVSSRQMVSSIREWGINE